MTGLASVIALQLVDVQLDGSQANRLSVLGCHG